MEMLTRRRQTTAALAQGLLSLPVTRYLKEPENPIGISTDTSKSFRFPLGIVSLYFQRSSLQEIGTGRNIQLFPAYMATYNVSFGGLIYDGPYVAAGMHFVDTVSNLDTYPISIDLVASDMVDPVTLRASVISKTQTWATGQGATINGNIVFPYDAAISANRTVSTPTRALSTAYTPSSTLPTLVIMSVEIDATLSLSGGTKGTITLLASNNGFSTSTTESEAVNGNTGTLTIGLNTVGAGGGVVMGYVPAGWAYKAVPASSTGTATFNVLSTTEIVGI